MPECSEVRRLSGLDAAFLALETTTSTGHVGGVSILDPKDAPEPLNLPRLTRILESRLDAVPVLRQRLETVPMGIDQPVWVDDKHFDIGYHVREIGLPMPGSDDQLSEQVSRIHARPLDRSRPLWETYLISGLSGGRVAVYTKVHHSAIDGVSGSELLALLFDLTPEGRPTDGQERPTFQAKPGPSRLELGLRGVARLAWRPVEVAQLATHAVRALPSVGPIIGPPLAGLLGLGRGEGSDGQVLPLEAAPIIAPQTPFNVAISPHRRFAFGSVSLPDVKRVKNAFGVSVNDVVMAMTAGALRTWLQEREALPDGPLVAMVPVSIRTAGTEVGGNKVSAMLAALPTHLDDPVGRLAVTRRVTMVAKSQQAFIPQGLVDEVSDFAPPAFTARAAKMLFASKVLHRLPAFNVVISNVPGPNIPIYLAGAKVLAHIPVSVVTDGIGLNVTVIGYLDQLHFGLIAAREVVPDLDSIMASMHEELAVLLAAAEERERDQVDDGAAESVSARPARGTARKRAARPRRSS
jgi:WS/DGAT/MGAT family acyltransferase